jgi:hypothetical protein
MYPYQIGQTRYPNNICPSISQPAGSLVLSRRAQEPLDLRRRCALCGERFPTTSPWSRRDVAAVDAQRISAGRPVFEPLEGTGFKCSGCRNALDAVLVRLDAQSVTQRYSPAKKKRHTQRVDKDEQGSRLESRCGSTGSRTELWDFSRQDDDTMRAAVEVLINRRAALQALQVQNISQADEQRRADEQRQAEVLRAQADALRRADELRRAELAFEHRRVAFDAQRHHAANVVEDRAVPFSFCVDDAVVYSPLTGITLMHPLLIN